LFFCNDNQCYLNWNGNRDGYSYVGLVNVPNSAKIYVGAGKFKANRIVVDNITRFDDMNDEFWLKIFEHDVNAFEYIKRPTHNTRIEAVKRDGMILRFIDVIDQTKVICETAVQQRGCALQFVPKELQTDDVCLLAVKQNAHAIEYIENPSKQLLDKLKRISPLLQLNPSSCKTNSE